MSCWVSLRARLLARGIPWLKSTPCPNTIASFFAPSPSPSSPLASTLSTPAGDASSEEARAVPARHTACLTSAHRLARRLLRP
eukprot:674810-Rhodomonas_salina.1